jgi:hypothetical protein
MGGVKPPFISVPATDVLSNLPGVNGWSIRSLHGNMGMLHTAGLRGIFRPIYTHKTAKDQITIGPVQDEYRISTGTVESIGFV